MSIAFGSLQRRVVGWKSEKVGLDSYRPGSCGDQVGKYSRYLGYISAVRADNCCDYMTTMFAIVARGFKRIYAGLRCPSSRRDVTHMTTYLSMLQDVASSDSAIPFARHFVHGKERPVNEFTRLGLVIRNPISFIDETIYR